MGSDFTWHENALKGIRGPIFDGEPMHGFYRQREQGKDRRTQGPYQAVAYWADEHTGELRCQVNGKSINMQRALEMWPYVSRNPISAMTYWNFMDHGRWDDEDAGAAAAAKGPEIDPEADPAGSLAAEIAAAKAGLAAYASIDSDEQSAKAQTLRSALTGLSGKATKAYEALNRPLLDEQQRIRKVWFPLRDEAADAADALRKAMGKWEDVKRDNAHRAADEAAKAAREAEEAGKPAPPPPPQNTPAPSTKIKGASGRAASVQLKKVVTAIDIDKAFAQFRDDPELYAFLLDLSQKTVTAGFVAIGATVEEKADIR
jgi:hypothetical protein